MATTLEKAKTKRQTATFKIKSPNNFINFLKKFSIIEKGLLLELTPESMLAKTHTPDRSTIKYSKIPLGDVLEGTVPCDLMKVALLDINKVINAFKHFNDGDEIFLDLSYDKVNDETVTFGMKIYSKSLKIILTCADPIQFTYISPEALKKIIQSVTDEKLMDFDFPKDAFLKINSLCGIDTAKDKLWIKVNEKGEVFVKSKSFEYHILDVPAGVEADLAFYNNQFGFIDEETSTFRLSQNKIMVRTATPDPATHTTIVILGRLE